MMETRELIVHLDTERVALRSHELATKVSEWSEANDLLKLENERHKDAARELKEQMEALQKRTSELGRAVRTKKEPQKVECEWRRNEEARPPTMELYRTDTGELVEDRPMTVAERQKMIKFPEAKGRE